MRTGAMRGGVALRGALPMVARGLSAAPRRQDSRSAQEAPTGPFLLPGRDSALCEALGALSGMCPAHDREPTAPAIAHDRIQLGPAPATRAYLQRKARTW